MVWPFTSSSPPSSSSLSTSTNAPEQTFPIPAIPASTQSSPPTQSTREDVADQELKSFIAEFEASAAQQRPSRPKFVRLSAPNAASSTNTDPESISEHLLPTTMSCRQAFDSAFYCNSFGGRFNDLYRYGTLRSCSESWNDFWFCMKTKSYGEPEKQAAIRGYYRGKERKKYGVDRRFIEEEDPKDKEKNEPNDGLGEGVGVMNYRGRGSEDVWKSRDRLVEEGTAFREPIVGWERGGDRNSDQEWNEKEIEKRRLDAARLAMDQK